MDIDNEKKQRSAVIKQTFNTVSESYDIPALRFFSLSSNYLASFLNLRGHEHVLDVATGTGHAAVSIAGHLPKGRVTGIDFSTGMIDQARKKAVSLNMENVEFLECDMQEIGFPDNQFDAAVCAFGIFFVEDMDAQLSNIVRCVKPGGKIAITCFQESYFSPLKEKLLNRLIESGVRIPPQTWKRIASEAGCRELFAHAGLHEINIEKRNFGYYLQNGGDWWDVVWNAGYRRMISQLSPEDQERFKREHLKEIETLKTNNGIWLDVGVLFGAGVKF